MTCSLSRGFVTHHGTLVCEINFNYKCIGAGHEVFCTLWWSQCRFVKYYFLAAHDVGYCDRLFRSERFLYVSPGLTFKYSTWSSLCFECFVWISEQTVTVALYIINWLVFITVVAFTARYGMIPYIQQMFRL